MSEGHTERLEAALAGRYKIERKLGEGGMASVYLAEDLKHKRKVALKILRPELAAVIGAERFLAEIQTTANLQHPHILPLFDSGSADGYLYYVMPYIDGETLRDKLDREKQLGVEESVRIARDVADALDYAHRHGVIHRDIKPGNILLHDGRPVVADFGIALAVSAAGGGRMTETGLSLGTPHYMSPEQASADRDLSARSDVYSLGCVLYEMLAGQPPHTGPSAQSILVHILTKEVTPLTELRHTVPPNVAAAVSRAIEKLPADRFETAKTFRDALDDTGFTYSAPARTAAVQTAPKGSSSRDWRVPTAFGIAGAMTVVAAVALLRPAGPASSAEVVRFAIPLPDSLGMNFLGSGPDLAISPNGRSIVYQGEDASRRYRFLVRSLDGLDISPLRGPDDPAGPFVAPDGQWIGFFDRPGRKLQQVSALGGPPLTLAQFPDQMAGSDWSPDGSIVAGTGGGGLFEVPEGGGEPRALTVPRDGEQSHTAPQVIPDRDAVVFVITPASGSVADSGRLAVLDRASGEITPLGLAGFSPRYLPTGHLVYAVADGSLRGVRFDARSLSVLGSPVPLVEDVATKSSGAADYDISDNGTLVYLSASSAGVGSGLGRLAVVDLEGNQQVLPLAPRNFDGRGPAWSPDGRSVAFTSDTNVFTYDVVLNTTPRQITFQGENYGPVFSPDGSRLAFSSIRPGTNQADLFQKNLDDDSPPRMLITLDGYQDVDGWPSDSILAFSSSAPGGGSADLWTLDLADPEAPAAKVYLPSEANLFGIAVSPDGRLAAYASNETGRAEIYLRNFPNAGQQTRVSQERGATPFWAPDGNTLYYAAQQGGPVIAARLRRGAVPSVLGFDTLFVSPATLQSTPNTGLHPDGDRFIYVVADPAAGSDGGERGPQQLIVVLNFFEVLKERLGTP